MAKSGPPPGERRIIGGADVSGARAVQDAALGRLDADGGSAE